MQSKKTWKRLTIRLRKKTLKSLKNTLKRLGKRLEKDLEIESEDLEKCYEKDLECATKSALKAAHHSQVWVHNGPEKPPKRIRIDSDENQPTIDSMMKPKEDIEYEMARMIAR